MAYLPSRGDRMLGSGKKKDDKMSLDKIKEKDIDKELEKLEKSRVIENARMKSKVIEFERLLDQGRKANEKDKKEIAKKLSALDIEIKEQRSKLSKIDISIKALTRIKGLKSEDKSIFTSKLWKKLEKLNPEEIEKLAYEKNTSESEFVNQMKYISRLPESEVPEIEDEETAKFMDMINDTGKTDAEKSDLFDKEYSEAEKRINDLLNSGKQSSKPKNEASGESNKQ